MNDYTIQNILDNHRRGNTQKLYNTGKTARDGPELTLQNISVVTIPDFAMRYISRYLSHDAICIAILVYRVIQYFI